MLHRSQSFLKSKFLLLPGSFVIVTVTAFLSYHYFQAKELSAISIRDEVPTEPPLVQPSVQPSVAPTPMVATFQVPILMYHYVEHVTDLNDTLRQKLAITPEVLDSQLK